MVFSWLKRRRRARLAAQEFPARWHEFLWENVALYRTLDDDERRALQGLALVFLAEKNWEGCGGLALTDEMRVTISALACLLLLKLDHDYFSHVLSILVYPSEYAVPQAAGEVDWLVAEESDRLGEAWYRGPVILAWDETLANSRRPRHGENLVLHEFAHQLDMLDRSANGTPPLGDRHLYKRWVKVMSAEYERLIADAEHGRRTLLDIYGTTSEAEFFSVATECFFMLPNAMKSRHPALYDLLRTYFRQDTAARLQRYRESRRSG